MRLFEGGMAAWLLALSLLLVLRLDARGEPLRPRDYLLPAVLVGFLALINPPAALGAYGALGVLTLKRVPVRRWLGVTLVMTTGMTTLMMLARERSIETHAAPAGAAPPRFLDRLPLKLRGGLLYAVQAEDHYLRLHTSKGQDLILLRLSDAVAELEGIEGAQTHRSWWVAKDAVEAAKRGDGRAVLTLKGGVEVPVSRAYARGLREAGWF